jgi:hypothetical protein
MIGCAERQTFRRDHNYNTATGMGTMQLVKKGTHGARGHIGGVSQFKAAHGVGYDQASAVKFVDARPGTPLFPDGLLLGRKP